MRMYNKKKLTITTELVTSVGRILPKISVHCLPKKYPAETKVADQMKAPVNANRANTGTGSLAIPAPNPIKCRTPGK